MHVSFWCDHVCFMSFVCIEISASLLSCMLEPGHARIEGQLSLGGPLKAAAPQSKLSHLVWAWLQRDRAPWVAQQTDKQGLAMVSKLEDIFERDYDMKWRPTACTV